MDERRNGATSAARTLERPASASEAPLPGPAPAEARQTRRQRVAGAPATAAPRATGRGPRLLGRLSVRGKLVASFSLLSVLVVALLAAGLTVAGSAHSAATEARTNVAATRVLKQLQVDAVTVAVAENSVAFDFASHGAVSGDLQSFTAGVRAFEDQAKVVQKLPLASVDQAHLNQALSAFDQYVSISKQVNADYATGTPASLAAAGKGVAALSFGSVITPIDHLVNAVSARVNATTASALSSASTDRNLLIGLGAFVLLLAIGSAIAIVASITRPISTLNATLSAVAAGDLSARAEVASHDELGQLAGALNEAIASQQEARHEVATQGALQAELSADNAAVLAVLNALREARSVEAAVGVALGAIREHFGWAYGSYFAADPSGRGLLLAAESGSLPGGSGQLGEGTRIAEGADLDGRALARRALVTSDGLEELSDSPRAVAARRAGVRTAASFPILAGGGVTGTMSFFGPPQGPALSASRQAAMANAGEVVSQAIERIADQEREREAEGELRNKVDQILDVVSAAASGDLTVSVPVAGEDAIGQVGTSLSMFLGDLRERMRAIGENSSGLALAIAELSGQGGGPDAVLETGPSAGSVETVAAAAEELTASIQEIAKSAADAARVALEAASMAESTNSTVTSLGESSAEIGQVIKMITLIAEQTNMLALNATIEAARAGEAGKGFAVVASEVKDLARETTSATDDISARIQAIQGDATGAVGAIGSIKEIVDRISELQSAIASAVEEQTATTNEIARSMSGAAQATGEIGRMTFELQGLITRFTY